LEQNVKKAIYAGSFDILTWGHIYVIRQGLQIFDEVEVAIGHNPDKKGLFSLDERREMLEECVLDTRVFTPEESKQLKVSIFEKQYLIDYAYEVGAQFYLRGIRSANDYEFESGLAQINHNLSLISTNLSFLRGTIKPVWIPCDPSLAHIASSTVKALIGPKGWERAVADYVPPTVYKRILEKFTQQ
jgi:pantetheine-phosphate adenylyltransferase